MIRSRLRARWRALTAVLGLDRLRSEPDLHRAEQALLALIADRVDPAAVAHLHAPIVVDDDDDVLALIRRRPAT